MANLNSRFRSYINTIPVVFRYILLGLLVLFISLFFPNNIRLDYDFDRGESWQYENLRAPFSFPIKKMENQLKNEREELAENFRPYYRLNNKVKEELKASFIEKFEKKYTELQKDTSFSALASDSLAHIDLGMGLLDMLYSQHIIKIHPQHEDLGDDFSFVLIENNVEVGEQTPGDFLSEEDAAQIIVDSLEAMRGDLTHVDLLFSILEDLTSNTDIRFDADLTQKNKELTINNVSPVEGMVKTGELIIRRGDIIDSSSYAKLISYREKYNQQVNKHKNSFLIYFGYLILTVALLSIFTIFVRVYASEVFDNLQHLLLIIGLIAGYSYLAYAIDQWDDLSSYLIPFCIVPIIVKNFFSSELALFTHIVVILLASMLLSLDYQFILVQIIVGMVAIMSKQKTRYLTDFFFSVLYIGIAYTACYLSLELIHRGAITPVTAEDGRIIEEGVQFETLGWIGLNIFLTLLSYPLIPLLERAFGLISEITLVELSDLNKPLLKELSFKAPGTMQHSLQVANLAEAAATEVGANALLVKVGALYHDIGKTLKPEFFIENQNQYNPHEDISDKESAQMIISHVTEGIKMAKKNRLPTVLIDFIKTHHGSTRVEYFYRMHKKAHPDESVDEADFTYPGPKPRNKEEAILMMADSLEAASKSLKNPTGQDIDALVENIISFKIKHGQLEDTNLNFKEINQIKDVFKKLLRSIHHVRIEYPEDEQTEEDTEDDSPESVQQKGTEPEKEEESQGDADDEDKSDS